MVMLTTMGPLRSEQDQSKIHWKNPERKNLQIFHHFLLRVIPMTLILFVVQVSLRLKRFLPKIANLRCNIIVSTCMCVCVCVCVWKWLSHVQLCNPMDCSPWNSPGQNTGVGGLSLLQGIFPAQGSNPGLSHWRLILYQLIHQGCNSLLIFFEFT